jgi:hypothetical protein
MYAVWAAPASQLCISGSLLLLQVGILRRGKYFKGKKVGKGNAVNEV